MKDTIDNITHLNSGYTHCVTQTVGSVESYCYMTSCEPLWKIHTSLHLIENKLPYLW